MALDHNLSERKLRILQYIIQEYIETAEPVGSRTISKNKLLGVSAATIRNEMADLEEMGLLLQPHTSAGRIPSEIAYKLYVNELVQSMSNEGLNEEDIKTIESGLSDHIEQMQIILEETLGLLSKMTNYTAVAISKKIQNPQKIKAFKLVLMDPSNAVMILVMEDGAVKSTQLRLQIPLTEDKMEIVSQTLSENIIGKYIEDLNEDFITFVKTKIKEYSLLFDDLLHAISDNMEQTKSFKVLMNGAMNIFNFPEFNDLERAKSILTFMEQKNEIANLIELEGIEKDNLKIIIGDSSKDEIAGNLSLITASFNKDGMEIGKIGVIGPKRMDYSRAFNIINYLTQKINKLIDESKY